MAKKREKQSNNKGLDVAEQNKTPSGWSVLKQVVISSACWSLVGTILAIMYLWATSQNDLDDLLVHVLIYGLSMIVLAPLGALVGFIGTTRQVFLQPDGPMVQELDRRIQSSSAKLGLSRSATAVTSASSMPPSSSSDKLIAKPAAVDPHDVRSLTLLGETETTTEHNEEQDAARNFGFIFNSIMLKSGYWCFKTMVGFFLPSSKILFREMDSFRKKSSDSRTSAILVRICDSYIYKWQYRITIVGMILYGVLLLGGLLVLRMI